MTGIPPRLANQSRTLLRLLGLLRPHWRRDRDLPNRIRTLLAGEKSFGSRDRRLYRELIYTAVRYLPWIEPQLDATPDTAVATLAWLAADTPATAAFRAALTPGWPACPPDVAAQWSILRRGTGGPPAHNPSGMGVPPMDVPPRGMGVPPMDILPGRMGVPPMIDLLPAWFRPHCPAAFTPPELNALHTRAPLWLRLQTRDPTPVLTEFAERGWKVTPSPILPGALRFEGETDVTKTDAYLSGAIEIQDLGSQLILAAAGIAPGGHWLDACAGAGGKTLQLAALLGPTGQIDAHDIRPAALQELADRARRAGIAVSHGNSANLKSQISNLKSACAPIRIVAQASGPYDAVLVDAPCSGTGTWRRAPHLKWTTTPESITADATRQRDLLHRFSPLVKPGGRLIYATCSLSHAENEDIIAAFLAAHPDFSPAPLAGLTTPRLRAEFHLLNETSAPPSSLTILPSQHDTDGFFVAAMIRG